MVNELNWSLELSEFELKRRGFVNSRINSIGYVKKNLIFLAQD